MKSVEIEVVGLSHRVTPSTLRHISRHIDEEGAIAVGLEREPSNVHDANAVKVVIQEPPWMGLHIGYMRRGTAEVYAPAMDAEMMLELRAWLLWIDVQGGEAEAVMEWKSPGKKKKSKK